MAAATDVGFIEMQIAKVVGFGPPLAARPFHCVVLEEVSGDRHLQLRSWARLESSPLTARPSDALNLAAITNARVFVRLDLVDDFERLQADDSAEVRLLRLARTIPNMKITRATGPD